MSTKTLPAVALLIALIILSVIAYKYLPMFRPAADVRLAAVACDPGLVACQADLPGGGRLAFSVTPQPIRPLQRFDMTVVLQGTLARAIEIDFAGTQMDMGLIRPRLTGSGSNFSGTAVLPVCVTGSMEWEATVLVTTEGQRIAAPFRFTVPAR